MLVLPIKKKWFDMIVNGEKKEEYRWTISIYEKEDTTIRVTAVGAANNLAQNINKMFNKEKEYCKECIEKIGKVINKKEEQQ